MRAAAGLPDTAAVVERANGRYRLDRRVVDVDVWRLEAALAAADEGAADHYGVDFASGEDYTWAEPFREQLKRNAVRALASSVATRRAAGDLEGALGAVGREAAVIRTYRLLERRLAELGLEPGDDLRRGVGP